MAETKEAKVLVWTGKNEEEVNKYLKTLEDISWHYVVTGNKKDLYLSKDGCEKCINRLTEVKW
jgi:hypothetical protein